MNWLRPSPYRVLEKRIGYRFWRRQRLEHALTHPSFSHELGEPAFDNQRMEFLGDAALSLAAAEVLYGKDPDANEGDMTKLRSLMTSTKALATVAQRIELGTFLRLGKGEHQNGGRQRTSILADALEAVIGAAYLDGGPRAVQAIFRTLFIPLLDELRQGDQLENPKALLQAWAQRTCGQNPAYRVLKESGPAHRRRYLVQALVDGEVVGRGEGANKRDAETAAAQHALKDRFLN